MKGLNVFVLALASLGGASFGAHVSRGRFDSAADYLRRVLDGRPTQAIVLIQFQNHPGGKRPVKVMLEQDRDGKSRTTVLEPSWMKANVSVDDGVRLSTYRASERELRVEVSPMRRRMDPGQRMNLILKNYALTFDPGSTVAGRVTKCIVATPNAKEMPTRRFYVDAETSAVLRLQTVSAKGKATTLIDTERASLRTSIPRIDKIDIAPGATVARCASPRVVRDAAKAESVVGFAPRKPSSLPNGFIVYEIHIVGDEGSEFYGARLTDGLASGTVYQWRGSGDSRHSPFRGRADARDSEGVSYAFFGDVPSELRTRIAEAFAKAASDLSLERWELSTRDFVLEVVIRSLRDLLVVSPRNSGRIAI